MPVAAPLRPAALLIFAAVVSGWAAAQPPQVPVPAQPAPRTRQEKAEQAEVVYRAIAQAYASNPVEERILVTVRDAGDQTTSSEIVWRSTAGGPLDRIWSAELGSLRVYAKAGRFVAVHTLNPGTYFEAALPEGLTASELRRLLPPLPLPHALWILGDDLPGGTGEVIKGTDWNDSKHVDSGSCRLELLGRHTAGSLVATVQENPQHPPRLCGWFMPAALGSDLRLSLKCERLPASDPSTWNIAIEGRARVASISDLRPADAPVAPGQRVPAMGLMTADLGSWSLADAIATANDGPLNASNPTRPVDSFAVLVLVSPGAPNALAAADGARGAAAELRRDLDRRRNQGRTTLPRCFVRLVHVLDLPEINDPDGERARVSRQPTPTTEPSTVPLFAAGGKALLDSFSPGAVVAVVVVGGDEKLVASIPIDPTVPLDVDALTKRLRNAVIGPHDVDAEPAGVR